MSHPDFDGGTYDPALDFARLKTQMARVYWIMTHEPHWHTLAELSRRTGGSEAGVSARLRDFRKEKFREIYGDWIIERRRKDGGLHEYRARRPGQLTLNLSAAPHNVRTW